MICTHRIYKGEDVEFHIPFDVEDYTNLQIEFTTNGDYKVEAEEWAIEDGVITVHFYGGDLDILPDGVIRETLTYEVDGEDKVEQYTTNLYLKTPVGYSAMTPQDIYESGYTAGQEECVSATTEVYQSGYTTGYQSGYTDGYTSGYTSGTTAGEIVNYVVAISGDHQMELHGHYESHRLKINGVEFIHTRRMEMVAGVNYLEFKGWGSLPAKYPQPTTISLRVSKINTDGWSSGGTWEVNNVILNAKSVDNGGSVPTLWTNTGFKFYPISYEVEADPENPDYVWITADFGPCN